VPERFYLMADVGGTHIRTAVGTDDVHLLGKLHRKTRIDNGPTGVIEQIEVMARESVQEAGIDLRAVSGMVIAAPGPLDPATGVVYNAPNMPGWERVALSQEVTDRLGVPVRAVNDANAAAVGEFRFGAGRGCHNMVYLTVSTGIGGGVIVDGKLVEGSQGTAGEIGHMTIDVHGPRCPCGNIGCLEVLASGTSMGRIFRERLATGGSSIVTEWTDFPTGTDVTRAAAMGDSLSVEVFAEVARSLGAGVVNVVNIFNPDAVVLGGGVTQAGDRLFVPVREMVRARALPLSRDGVRVVPVELGDDAGLYGALAIARDQAVATDQAAPEAAPSQGAK
jgi:glucokinase